MTESNQTIAKDSVKGDKKKTVQSFGLGQKQKKKKKKR